RARREQPSAILPAPAEYPSDQVSDARTHLHARTLAAKREPGTHGEQPTDELHRYEAKWRLWDFLVQHCLDMGNAAPRCVRRVAANQPGRYRSRSSRRRRDKQETGGKYSPVLSGDQGITPTVCLLERQA